MLKVLCFLLIIVPALTFGQKRPLSHKDYDSWNSISETQITNNGEWVNYVLKPQDGDSKMVFYPLLGNAIDTIDRASEAIIFQNAQWAVFKISPSKKQMHDAKLAKKKKEDMPKDSLGIYNIAKYETLKIGNLKSFKVPENTSSKIVYLKNPFTPKPSDSLKTTKKKTKKESEENGSLLTVFDVISNEYKEFPFVYLYNVDKDSKNLVFASTGNDSTFKAGLYSLNFQSNVLTPILENKNAVKHLSVSDNAQSWAAIVDPDTTKKSLKKNNQLWFWNSDKLKAQLVADSTIGNGYPSWTISDDYEPRFSKNSERLFYGTKAPSLIKDTTRLEEDVVSLDVWTHNDKRLMPEQLVEYKTDMKASYLAVFNINNEKTNQLAIQDIPAINLTKYANEDYVLGVSDLKYSNQHWMFNTPKDLFSVSLKDGQATKILNNTRVSDLSVSPSGKYMTWYAIEDTTWYAYNNKSNKTIQLTSDKLFSNVSTNDVPDFPEAYGIAGYTQDEDQLIIYDEYDLWLIDLSKGNNKKLTNGRAEKNVFRYIKTDEKEQFIDIRKPILLHVFNQVTRYTGYASYSDFGDNKVVVHNMQAATISNKVYKAKEASDYVFTRESFNEFPDLYISGNAEFREPRKISNANPQQANINWLTAELIKYRNLDGQELEGILYKPENFDPNKKYPMLTYFYERLSENLYKYNTPQPGRASINFSYYASNGYLVFVPDIVYKGGKPGQNALECVMPGVFKVLENGYVDKDRLGIQGHSWGAYQAAYIITKTDIFKAAEAGAPVANMTSAYGGIRWESGKSRMAQYERTQSRIGETLWESPLKYIENSPLFSLPNIKTPLLMMHNDADGAVPWYQGIEMFMGLKRLNKPVWLLNYNGEKHGLTQRKNAKDWTIRMAQFFDYYLKDAPIPEWMEKGIPAIEKTLNDGLNTK